MTRKLLGVFTSITAALLVVSVAWAAGDSSRENEVAEARLAIAGEAVVVSSADSNSSSTGVTAPTGSSTSVTTGGSSSTSITSADSSSTTVTSAPGSSTSVTAGGSSSTSVTTRTGLTSSAGGTFQVSDAGSVTVEIRAGLLVLTDISAPGWDVRIKDARRDRVRIEFSKGESKAEFEAKLESGRLDVEIRRS